MAHWPGSPKFEPSDLFGVPGRNPRTMLDGFEAGKEGLLRRRWPIALQPFVRQSHRAGAALVLDKIRQRFPWLELLWADPGYNAHQVKDAVARSPGLRLEIVKRTDDIKGFVVLSRRWVVERTFSWFGRNRRLAKDYENLADTLAAFVTLAAIQFAIRRLARLGF